MVGEVVVEQVSPPEFFGFSSLYIYQLVPPDVCKSPDVASRFISSILSRSFVSHRVKTVYIIDFAKVKYSDRGPRA
jgi:hypothetical protein